MTEKKPSPSREALKVRARARNKKPKFVRAESWKYDRFSLSWRKPRGLDNKIRRKIKGWPARTQHGLQRTKSRPIPTSIRIPRSHSFQRSQTYQLLTPNTQAARIAHTVGKRKRALIIAEAKNLNIKILNIKVSKETEEKTEEEAEGEAARSRSQKKKTVKEEKPKKETKKKAPKKEKAKPKPKKGEKKQ